MAEEHEKSLSRWDPFAELSRFRGWDPFREMGLPFAGMSRLAPREGAGTRYAPPMDIAERDDGYAVTVELPGTNKEDVTVEVHEGVLTVRGEKRSEREEKDEQRHYVERTYGSFSRSFRLPANADEDRVNASFRDGVLTIDIAKTDEAKPKVVSVQS